MHGRWETTTSESWERDSCSALKCEGNKLGRRRGESRDHEPFKMWLKRAKENKTTTIIGEGDRTLSKVIYLLPPNALQD